MSTLTLRDVLRHVEPATAAAWQKAGRDWALASGEPRYYASAIGVGSDHKLRVAEVAGCTVLLRRTQIMGRHSLIAYSPPIPRLPGGSWQQAAHALELLRHAGVPAKLSRRDHELLGILPGGSEHDHDEHVYRAGLLSTPHVRYARNFARRHELDAQHVAGMDAAPATIRAMRALSERWRSQRKIPARQQTLVVEQLPRPDVTLELLWDDGLLVAYTVCEWLAPLLGVRVADLRDYDWKSPLRPSLLLHAAELEHAPTLARIGSGSGLNAGVGHHKTSMPGAAAPIGVYRVAAHRALPVAEWRAVA